MAKIRNGIYTTGVKSFRVSSGLNKDVVKISAINDIDDFPVVKLKTGQETQINKETFESFLNEEMKHYFWHKE